MALTPVTFIASHAYSGSTLLALLMGVLVTLQTYLWTSVVPGR